MIVKRILQLIIKFVAADQLDSVVHSDFGASVRRYIFERRKHFGGNSRNLSTPRKRISVGEKSERKVRQSWISAKSAATRNRSRIRTRFSDHQFEAKTERAEIRTYDSGRRGRRRRGDRSFPLCLHLDSQLLRLL